MQIEPAAEREQHGADDDTAEAAAAAGGAPREALSAAEERFERWRKTAGAFLAPAALLFMYWFLRDSGLSPQGRTLSAVLVFTAVMWVCETLPLPVTALLGAALCVGLGVGDAKTVFAPFADPIIFLFIGSFMLARAMEIHRLDRRIALGVLAVPWVGGRPGRVLFGMGLITAVLSMWVSNTATTAMMIPIALGILAALHDARVREGQVPAGTPMDARTWPFATGMLLMIAYAASIGGIGTKVGSPPNLITLGHLERAGIHLSFFRWMAIMVPMLCVMYAALFALLYLLHRDKKAPPKAQDNSDKETRAALPLQRQGAIDYERTGLSAYLTQERQQLGPWTRGQVNTLIAFAVAVTLWMLPGFAQAIFPSATGIAAFFHPKGQMPEAVVALVAALLLFVLPVNAREGKFTITWREASAIDWGTILLFGGGMALGELMFKTGVADALGKWAITHTGANSLWTLTAAMIVLGIVLSETTSNTAAAVMLAPVAISMAAQMGVSPTPPALGACLGASFGFMLPVSTPPNAIAFGTGLVPISRMVRAGILFDLFGAMMIWCGLRVLLPALGLV